MWAARISLFAAAIWGLYACTSGVEAPPPAPPPPPPAANSSLGSAAPIERIIGPLTPTEAQELDPAPRPPEPAAPPRPAAPAAPSPSKTTPAAPKPAAPSAAAITLDLEAMKKQLKETKAIGIFTKISLKNQVDDLLDKFRDYYKGSTKGKTKFTLTELRESYNLLMMKVLSLLQEKDPALAAAIVSSREAIWGLLADPIKFASLQV